MLHPDRVQTWVGQTWIADVAIQTYYRGAQVGDIVVVDGRRGRIYLELESYFEGQLGGVDTKGWWVHRIDPQGAFDDVTPEDIIGDAA